LDQNQQYIIQEAIKGDKVYQRKLYEMYRTRWYMICLRYGNSKIQADDLLQEGLIRIFQNLHQYNPKLSKFGTWSSRVVVNAALRSLEKSNWLKTIGSLEEADELVSQSPSVMDEISAKELTFMIQQLPVGYRIVFNMYAIEGYSHKEISTELGISEGTSKSQLSKARKHLRSALESQLNVTRS